MAKIKCEMPILSPIGSSIVRISGGTSLIKPHYYEDKIVSLEFLDGSVLSRGEKITIKRNSYKVNIIQKKIRKNILFYDLKVAEKTKSSIFITPMLGGEKKLWFYNQLLINTFIGIKGELEDKIVLLYRWSGDILFDKFQKTVRKFKSFYDMRNIDENHVLIIFDVPKKQKRNFELFKEGKYSKFNRNYKLKILEYHKMNVDNVIGQILFKTIGRKRALENKIGMDLPDDAELYSIPEKHVEHFDITYYL